MKSRSLALMLLTMLLAVLLAAMVGADDGAMHRRNVSRTPDAETESAQMGMMYLYVPAQAADGTLDVPIEYYVDVEDGAEPILFETRDFAKPLVAAYVDDVGHHDEEAPNGMPAILSGVTFGAFDTFGTVSLDDGTTWKEFNLSRAADLSSFTLQNGQAYPGSAGKAVLGLAGDRVMVAWTSKYCDGGEPNYTLTYDEITLLKDGYEDLGDLYFDLQDYDGEELTDLFGVSGTQKSVDYTLQGFPEVGEIPYSCVWTARGSLEYLDDGTFDVIWYKAERLTSGRRDANRIEISAVAGAGFAIMWQEDPEGLRPGQGLGPGEGWSGAVVNSKTDIWYSYIPWNVFELVEDETDPTIHMPIEAYALTGDEPMPKPAVPMAMPVRLTDNDLCKEGTLTQPEDAYCTYDFDADGTAEFCEQYISWTNPGGTTLNICQTSDQRVLTGRVGSSRPRVNMWPRDTDGDGVTDSAWVILAYEESKALGEGVDEEDVDPIDIGKNIWYHSFDMFNPDLVAQGGMLNQPAVDPETGEFFEILTDEWGYDFYETEISRRFSLVSQPLGNIGESGTLIFALFKQGIINQGGPADILARRFVLPEDYDPLTDDNPYAFSNMVCDEWAYTDGSNPHYLAGLCLAPPVNVSGTTIVDCEGASGNDACAAMFPWDGGTQDFPKVTEWRFCDGSAIDGCEDDSDLDDQSWENPFDVAKGHRGFLDGDFLMVLYAWSPNWQANSVGNDHYNLYVRRSFDGGQTFTTTPADLDGAGTEFYEYYYTDTVGHFEEVLYSYGPGEFEQARNVSKLTGNRETVLDPRYSPTGGGNLIAEIKCWTAVDGLDVWTASACSDPLPFADDLERDSSKFFLVFETGDNTTVAEGEAVPLDLFYSRGTVYGDIYDEVEYYNNSTGDLETYWDWLENKADDLSGEASVTANLGGTFFYAIWNQWNELEEDVITNSDAWFRRLMWIDDADALPSGSILYVSRYGADPADVEVTFFGSARDNDHMGQGIVDYAWTSSLDGFLGDTKTLVVQVADLSLGLHTITFTACDGEGNWSHEVSVPLLIGESVGDTYVPAITR